MRSSRLPLWLGGLLVACAPEPFGPPVSASTGPQTPRLELFPAAVGTARAQPVLALGLRYESEASPEPWLLVEGNPTSATRVNLQQGLVSEAIRERLLPLRDLPQVDSHSRLFRPTVPLLEGQRYTLIGPGALALPLDITAEPALPYWSRLLPTGNRTARVGVYCGAPARVQQDVPPPVGASAQFDVAEGLGTTGALKQSCVTVRPREASGEFIAPVSLKGVALDPSPFRVSNETREVDSLCPGGVALGAGCLRIGGEALEVEEVDGEALWNLTCASKSVVRVVSKGKLTLPWGDCHERDTLEALRLDASGVSSHAIVKVALPPPAPNVVINEVLANPSGQEPQQEWIELANLGRATASIADWRLQDGGGEVTLPSFVMAPGAFALLVRDNYVAPSDKDKDMAPAEGTLLIRLPQLGHSGLSNSGEALALVDANGRVLARYPALAATRAGVSRARRPGACSGAAADFAEHASPGASPGAPNVFE